tara:strand:+ start:226 stop:516 length:291 start_codon:yes stop_codon:yes gene_type:complete
MTLITEDVEVGRNLLGNKMIWVGEKITVANLLDKYSYLKEEFGLNALRLAYSVGLSETTISRIFNKKHKANRSTLIALDVALNEWSKVFEDEGTDE